MREVLGVSDVDERVNNRSTRSRASRDNQSPRNQRNQRASYGGASTFDGPENYVRSWSHYNPEETKAYPKEQYEYPTKGRSKQQGNQHYKQSRNEYNTPNNAVQYNYPADTTITLNEREEAVRTLVTLLRNKGNAI